MILFFYFQGGKMKMKKIMLLRCACVLAVLSALVLPVSAGSSLVDMGGSNLANVKILHDWI